MSKLLKTEFTETFKSKNWLSVAFSGLETQKLWKQATLQRCYVRKCENLGKRTHIFITCHNF